MPVKKPVKKSTYRPIVLERWQSYYSFPHRLVILEDGSLEVQWKGGLGWKRCEKVMDERQYDCLESMP